MNKYIQIDFKMTAEKYSDYETVIQEFLQSLFDIGIDDVSVHEQDFDEMPF